MSINSAEQRLNAAVLALVYVGRRKEKEFVAHGEIARSQNIPTREVISLMQNLAAAGFVRTRMGRQGGVSISKPLGQISLKELYDVCAQSSPPSARSDAAFRQK